MEKTILLMLSNDISTNNRVAITCFSMEFYPHFDGHTICGYAEGNVGDYIHKLLTEDPNRGSIRELIKRSDMDGDFLYYEIYYPYITTDDYEVVFPIGFKRKYYR